MAAQPSQQLPVLPIEPPIAAQPVPIPLAVAVAKPITNSDKRKDNYPDAWKILQNDDAWKLPADKVTALSIDYGVFSAEELVFLDEEEIQGLAAMLKKAQSRKFLQLLED